VPFCRGPVRHSSNRRGGLLSPHIGRALRYDESSRRTWELGRTSATAMKSRSSSALLLGTWRFDKRRTVGEWVSKRPLTKAQIEILFRHTEKLRIRFTRTHRTMWFRSVTDRSKYRTASVRSSTDSGPVSIAVSYSLPHGTYRNVITFESDRVFFIEADGRREYFRRVPPNSALQRTGRA
jgi:hypothetical protein